MSDTVMLVQVVADRDAMYSRVRELEAALSTASAEARKVPDLESRCVEMKDLVVRLGKESQTTKGGYCCVGLWAGFLSFLSLVLFPRCILREAQIRFQYKHLAIFQR